MTDYSKLRGVYPKELEQGMTAEEVRQLKECPDCHGYGNLTTPAKNWSRRVTCSRCHGSGLVREIEQAIAALIAKENVG